MTRAASAVLLLMAAVFVHAQSIDRAEALWKAQNFDGANNEFKALVAAHPENADYRVRWGNLFAERFNAQEASKLYQEALTINPKHARAMLGLAEIAADNFDPKSVEFAKKASEADPKLYEAHEVMARGSLEDDDHKTASAEADAALAIEPNALQAIAIKAALDLLDDKESPWLAKIGNRGKGYETIAYFFVINRRYEDGINYYRKAIAVTPDLWSAHSQLGINLMRLAREDEARKELELAYGNHYRDKPTVNTLTLMDSYNRFVTNRTPTTVLKLNAKEADLLRPYFQAEMEKIMTTYEKKYKVKLTDPVQVEVYPDHEDFAVRTMGMPGLGALGVTFNNVIAMDSPSGRAPGSFHWASTLWHEMSHVYVLSLTNDRVPRWFTEGMAVHEETAINADWGDRLSPDVIAAIRDKKLLPVAGIDRGFVHPSFPAQVIVSYYQAGKICDFIASKWGESKLLDMVHAFAKNKPTVDVIREQLGMEPEAFDKELLALIDKETNKTVAGFEEWTKGVRQLNQLAKEGKTDELIAKGKAIEPLYPEYVEAGSVYSFVADACIKKSDTACAIDELGRYSQVGGRDPETMKKYGKLLADAGKSKEAAAALQRMVYIYPQDVELHKSLGSLALQLGNTSLAVGEFQALVNMHPIDGADAHYNLARAFKAAGRKDQAREEAVLALESAPSFKPALKLLLEVSADDK